MEKSCLFVTPIIFATVINLSFSQNPMLSRIRKEQREENVQAIESNRDVVYSRRCGIWEKCIPDRHIDEPTRYNDISEIFNIGTYKPTRYRGPIGERFNTATRKPTQPSDRLWEIFNVESRKDKRVPKWRHHLYETHNPRRCGIWDNCDPSGFKGPESTEFTASTEAIMSTTSLASTKSTRNIVPYWEHFNPETSVLPNDAIIGGYENETLYIIRSVHKNSLTPGKYIPSQHKAFIPWGYKAHEKVELEILRGNKYKWIRSNKDIPKEAVVGGTSEHYHDLLYVCRGTHLGYTIPGKIDPHYDICYIPYNGEELEREMGNYEILVVLKESLTEKH